MGNMRAILSHCAQAWSPRATLRTLLPARGGTRRFAALDGVRALALIWVLAYHSTDLSNMRVRQHAWREAAEGHPG